MYTVSYFIGDREESFESMLPYTMIGMIGDVVIGLFQNYREVERFGNRYGCSFSLAPCIVTGESPYVKEYKLEVFDTSRAGYKWVEYEKVLHLPSKTPKKKG